MITCNDERHRQHALLRQRPALGLCRALAKGRRSCRGVGESRCTFEQLTLGVVC